jgi:hypothetical protein
MFRSSDRTDIGLTGVADSLEESGFDKSMTLAIIPSPP